MLLDSGARPVVLSNRSRNIDAMSTTKYRFDVKLTLLNGTFPIKTFEPELPDSTTKVLIYPTRDVGQNWLLFYMAEDGNEREIVDYGAMALQEKPVRIDFHACNKKVWTESDDCTDNCVVLVRDGNPDDDPTETVEASTVSETATTVRRSLRSFFSRTG